jgi:hypothetical protein
MHIVHVNNDITEKDMFKNGVPELRGRDVSMFLKTQRVAPLSERLSP